MLPQPDLLMTLRDIEDNEDNLRQLIGQLKTPLGVIPFIGAGLSIPFGFPGWRNFLIAKGTNAGIEERIRQHLDAGEYEEAAEALLDARRDRAFHDAISNTFGVHKLQDQELRGAVSLLPHLTTGPVITTNFDHVLEEVFKQAECPFDRVVPGAKPDLATLAFQQNRRFLLKIHGDAEERTDRILTKRDYQQHYGGAEGSSVSLPLPLLLQQMLLSRPLLFVGASLNEDRTITVLRKVVSDYRSLAHYAVVEQPAAPAEFYDRSRFLSDHTHPPDLVSQ